MPLFCHQVADRRSACRPFMLSAVLTTFCCAISTVQAAPPNVLIIMADDCTYNDLPLYGGQNAVTPNIDRLAAEGLVFNRAYLASAMCQPCRAELFTGLSPLRNGCAWNHSACQPDIRSMPHHLGQAGYRVGIAGKVHVKPDKCFPFENVDGFDPNCVRNPTRSHSLAGVRKFLSADDPFCLVVALVEPHVPWVMGDPSKYPPADIRLPPNIADTDRTRQDFGRYLAEITYMDGQVGELLQVLNAVGKADDTLVLFTSEQGSQFPGCKWTNWDTGLHTALIARWPGRIPGGKRTDALVQYCDVLPTLLDLAEIPHSGEQFTGSSFRDVLFGKTDRHRDFVYGMHNNLPEGPAYPIRTITDGQYRLIRNLTPGELYIEKHLMGLKGDGLLNNPYWGSWVWGTEEDPNVYRLVKRYMLRPAEQFYHTANDPYEMHDLSAGGAAEGGATAERSAAADAVRRRLSAELDRWTAAEGDPGAPMDTVDALRAARQGQHLFPAAVSR